jgi:hypothetical protein
VGKPWLKAYNELESVQLYGKLKLDGGQLSLSLAIINSVKFALTMQLKTMHTLCWIAWPHPPTLMKWVN